MFDPTILKKKTVASKAGGGYTSFRLALKEWFDVVPLPDVDNSGKISNDYIFLDGYDWIYIYTDDKEFDLNEDPAESGDGYTSVLTGFFPGENPYMRQFINDGLAGEDVYALLDNCNEISTLSVGKGKCCPAKLKIKFKSGKKTADVKGWEFTLSVEQEGVNCHYEGVGAMNTTYMITPDDATPDVSKGTAIYRLPENSGVNEITALDNAVQGSLITLQWDSDTNHSTISNGAVFQLAGDFTPVNGAILILQATTSGTFAERYRSIPV